VETTFDVVVVGAGLAGLSVAVALSDLGLTTTVIEKGIIGSGSSGVPIGLINPAAAKQANLSWNAKLCISAIGDLLDRARPYSDKEFFRKSGVLRPSVDVATLEAFSTSLKRHNYPNGWAKWMEKEEVDAYQPGLVHAGGALWVNEGFTVDSTSYLLALNALLQANGGTVRTETEIATKTWISDAEKWQIVMSDGTTLQAAHIVSTLGSAILDDPDWKWLPVHNIKGQMATYRSSEELPWSHAIAGRGYVAHLNGFDWVIGSTFEHKYDDVKPDETGLHYLEQKVDLMLPELRQRSELHLQWAGVRVGTPNRLPIVGPHPTLPKQWVFTGLGSKGLLFSAYLGQLLAENMVNNVEIPLEVSTKRLKNEN
jgi:glycine oxidase